MPLPEGYASSLGDKKAITRCAEERVKDRAIASCCSGLLGSGGAGFAAGSGEVGADSADEKDKRWRLRWGHLEEGVLCPSEVESAHCKPCPQVPGSTGLDLKPALRGRCLCLPIALGAALARESERGSAEDRGRQGCWGLLHLLLFSVDEPEFQRVELSCSWADNWSVAGLG